MHNRLDLAAQLALRTREMMVRHLGAAALRAFGDPDVTEIYVNPDGRLRLERRSRGASVEAEVLEAEQVYRFLNTVASSLGLALDEGNPQIQAELPQEPFGGARLQGFVPPLVAAPCFVVRKLPDVVYSLDDYVEEEVLLPEHRDLLRTAVDQRWNVLVAGGTGSGKTTFANALLLEIAERCPSDRIVVLEDTVELQSSASDTLALRTTPELSLADLVKASLRTKPDRIVIGEVRDAAALDLLDAWATGHPGGVATLHATDPLGALHRLDRLAQRANVPSQQALITEAVQLVVLIHGGHSRRRVREISHVRGLDALGEFRLETA